MLFLSETQISFVKGDEQKNTLDQHLEIRHCCKKEQLEFSVCQNKENHSGLETHQGEQIMTEFDIKLVKLADV